MTRQVKIEEAIRVAMDNNLLFYAYRKPGEDIEFGLQLTTLAERKSREKGFIISPFIVTEDTPELFIKQEYSLSNFPCEVERRDVEYPKENIEIEFKQYEASAKKLILEMNEGRYQKAVLSRTIGVDVDARNSASEWFLSLCENYPNAYVYIFSVPEIATWETSSIETSSTKTSSTEGSKADKVVDVMGKVKDVIDIGISVVNFVRKVW